MRTLQLWQIETGGSLELTGQSTSLAESVSPRPMRNAVSKNQTKWQAIERDNGNQPLAPIECVYMCVHNYTHVHLLTRKHTCTQNQF